jgi:integrin-linked kinase-associated serine/threonine phosphatase 2C
MITHSISLIGKRNANEDQHDIIINIKDDHNNKNILKNMNFLSVYDGHGGKHVSKFLKYNLSKYFISKGSNFDMSDRPSNISKYITKVFHHVQNKLEIQCKNFSEHVGSTALVLLHFKKDFYIANLGDCRAVLCNKKNCGISLTKDHKPNSYEEKIRIENVIKQEKSNVELEFDGYDWRIEGLSVSRAFGDLDAKPYVTHIPEVFHRKVSPNDKFIILACDGLWDVISNQDAVDFVLNKIKNINDDNFKTMTGTSNNNIAKLLAEHAINIGSLDNVSIVILFLIDKKKIK